MADRALYASPGDMLKGDMPLPARYGDGTGHLARAADDIDAQLGHIYVTPIVIDSSEPENRPSILLLKKINYLLASGRLIMDMALGGEDNNLNAYGASLYKEGRDLLNMLSSESMVLRGADKLDSENDRQSTGPMILNEDSQSLVSNFYAQGDPMRWRQTVPRAKPYDVGPYVPQTISDS